MCPSPIAEHFQVRPTSIALVFSQLDDVNGQGVPQLPPADSPQRSHGGITLDEGTRVYLIAHPVHASCYPALLDVMYELKDGCVTRMIGDPPSCICNGDRTPCPIRH
jgi:hypothetical protein